MRESVIHRCGLPPEFGGVVLILALILCLAPYLSGMDFGIFKVPVFSERARRKLRLFGPLILVATALLFIPLLNNDPNEPPQKVKQALKRIHEFSSFASDTASVAEAEGMLHQAGVSTTSHTIGSDHVIGRVDDEWTITVWAQSYGQRNVYGVRYNNRDPKWNWQSTYFEVAIRKETR